MTSGRLDRLFQASKPLSLERRRIGIVPISEDIRPLGVNGSERGEEVHLLVNSFLLVFKID